MDLSPAQMAAVNHGAGKDVPTWSLVDLPAGPQPIPRWAKGLHINWMDGYGNSPEFHLKASESPTSWPEQRFVFIPPKLYLARHPDGRAEAHYHTGSISEVEIEHQVRTGRQEWRKEKRKALATTQQDGYAGRGFPIVLGGRHPLRGKTVLLRGPWHGSPPKGYQEVYFWYPDSLPGVRDQRPWQRQMHYFGLYLTDDLLLRLFARYCPHLRLARVGAELQPLKPEWDAPKRWIQEREREHFIAMRDSMMPPKAWAA